MDGTQSDLELTDSISSYYIPPIDDAASRRRYEGSPLASHSPDYWSSTDGQEIINNVPPFPPPLNLKPVIDWSRSSVESITSLPLNKSSVGSTRKSADMSKYEENAEGKYADLSSKNLSQFPVGSAMQFARNRQ